MDHFATFEQFDQWIHLACVYSVTTIGLAYNELFSSRAFTFSITRDIQEDNDRYMFGNLQGIPAYLHEARFWKSARSHG